LDFDARTDGAITTRCRHAAMPPCRHAAHAAYAAYAAYATDAYLALCRRSALRSPVH